MSTTMVTGVPTLVFPAGSVVTGVSGLLPDGSGAAGVHVQVLEGGITIFIHPGIGLPFASLILTLSPGVPLPVRVGGF